MMIPPRAEDVLIFLQGLLDIVQADSMIHRIRLGGAQGSVDFGRRRIDNPAEQGILLIDQGYPDIGILDLFTGFNGIVQRVAEQDADIHGIQVEVLRNLNCAFKPDFLIQRGALFGEENRVQYHISGIKAAGTLLGDLVLQILDIGNPLVTLSRLETGFQGDHMVFQVMPDAADLLLRHHHLIHMLHLCIELLFQHTLFV